MENQLKSYFKIGRLGKLFGLEGDVRLHCDEQYEEILLQHFNEHKAIFIGIDGFKIPLFIQHLNLNKALVRIDKIKNQKQLKELVGQDIFIEGDERLDQVASDLEFLAGFFIVDSQTNMQLGEIVSVEIYPAHPMAFISDGNDEMMIPLVEDWIVEVDVANKLLHMNLPEGLI